MNIPKNFTDRINSLTMCPDDWSELNKILSNEDYRIVVNEYQRREQQNLPICSSIFKICIYSHGGKCCCKNSCKFKH